MWTLQINMSGRKYVPTAVFICTLQHMLIHPCSLCTSIKYLKSSFKLVKNIEFVLHSHHHIALWSQHIPATWANSQSLRHKDMHNYAQLIAICDSCVHVHVLVHACTWIIYICITWHTASWHKCFMTSPKWYFNRNHNTVHVIFVHLCWYVTYVHIP